MRVRTEGGLSGTYNNSTINGGSGMWTMRDLERNLRTNTWPSDYGDGVDTYFNTNPLLLHADGSNNDTNNNIIDSSTDKIPFSGTYSVYFSGTTDQIAFASNTNLPPGTGDFCVEFWFMLNSTSASSPGNFFHLNVNGSLGIWLSNTKIEIARYGIAADLSYSVTLTPGIWYHGAFTRESGTGRIFLNGALVLSGSITTNYSTQNGAVVGGAGVTAGFISNLRYVKGAAVYTSAFTPSTTPLTAISGTQLLTCQSSTIVDNSSNASTPTLSGSPTVSSGSYPVALTRTNNPTQGTFSPYTVPDGYWSNYFDGVSFHSIAASANFLIGTQNFTMEFWVLPLAIALQGLVVSHQTGGMFQFNMTATGALSINVNSSGGASSTYSSFTTTTLLTAGVWTHVAIVRNGTEVACYINGVKDATTLTLAGGTNIGSYGGNKAIYIGAGADQGSKFTGFISNVRYIVGTAQYTTGFTPSTSPLTAVSGTQLLTCMHNRFRDISTNSWTITSTTVRARPESPFAATSAYSASADGGSLVFNGSSDYARIAVAQAALGFGTGDFTIECWLYFYGTPTGFAWDIRTSGGGAAQTKPLVSIGSTTFALNIGTTAVITSSAVNTVGQWFHVAIVRSSGSTKMYINGVQQSTVYTDTNNYGTSSQLALSSAGDSPGYPGTFMNGYMCDFRVTKSAVYTSAFTPPTSPLAPINNTTMLLSGTNAKIIDQTSLSDFVTFSGAKLSTAQSKFGGSSILLNGSTDYLAPIGVLPGFGKGDFTIECWIYLNSTAGTQNIIDGRPAGTASNANYPTLAYVSNSLNYYTGAGLVITGGALNAGQWYHVALCRSSGTTKLFVDGVQKGSSYTDAQTYLNGTNRPAIGTDGNSPSNYFNGYIDEFRMSRVARYPTAFTAPTAPFKNR
jgi:hypothetical protein